MRNKSNGLYAKIIWCASKPILIIFRVGSLNDKNFRLLIDASFFIITVSFDLKLVNLIKSPSLALIFS